jgi:hypothetical protein
MGGGVEFVVRGVRVGVWRGCMMEGNRGMREKSKVLINPRTFSKI